MEKVKHCDDCIYRLFFVKSLSEDHADVSLWCDFHEMEIEGTRCSDYTVHKEDEWEKRIDSQMEEYQHVF